MSIELKINGRTCHLDRPCTVLEYLRSISVDPLTVAIQLNEKVLSRDSYAQSSLSDGDSLEVLKMVGGG